MLWQKRIFIHIIDDLPNFDLFVSLYYVLNLSIVISLSDQAIFEWSLVYDYRCCIPTYQKIIHKLTEHKTCDNELISWKRTSRKVN